MTWIAEDRVACPRCRTGDRRAVYQRWWITRVTEWACSLCYGTWRV